MMDKCPHERIQYCPLFVESHNCRLLGCVDDMQKPCQVERGKLNYDKAVAKLQETDPALINEITWARTAYESREQRQRNLRVNGIH